MINNKVVKFKMLLSKLVIAKGEEEGEEYVRYYHLTANKQ